MLIHLLIYSFKKLIVLFSPMVHRVMNARHTQGGSELTVPVSRSRIMWPIASPCYTQIPGCSDSSQNILLAYAWGSWNVDGLLEIKGPSIYMINTHMCIDMKSEVIFLKWPLVVELKLRMWKMTGLQISPLPTNATFKMLLYFLHLWSIGQKGLLSDLKRPFNSWITGQIDQRLQIFAIFCIITISYP